MTAKRAAAWACVWTLALAAVLWGHMDFVRQALETMPEAVAIRLEQGLEPQVFLRESVAGGLDCAGEAVLPRQMLSGGMAPAGIEVEPHLASAGYGRIAALHLIEGSFFGDTRANVIVISSQLARRLTMTPEAVGIKVRMNDTEYTVCGVYQSSEMWAAQISRTDREIVYLPMANARPLKGAGMPADTKAPTAGADSTNREPEQSAEGIKTDTAAQAIAGGEVPDAGPAAAKVTRVLMPLEARYLSQDAEQILRATFSDSFTIAQIVDLRETRATIGQIFRLDFAVAGICCFLILMQLWLGGYRMLLPAWGEALSSRLPIPREQRRRLIKRSAGYALVGTAAAAILVLAWTIPILPARWLPEGSILNAGHYARYYVDIIQAYNGAGYDYDALLTIRLTAWSFGWLCAAAYLAVMAGLRWHGVINGWQRNKDGRM